MIDGATWQMASGKSFESLTLSTTSRAPRGPWIFVSGAYPGFINEDGDFVPMAVVVIAHAG